MKKLNYFIKSEKSALIIIGLILCLNILTMKGFNPYGLIILLIGGLIYDYNRSLMGSVWTIKVKKSKKLITRGLFKHIRHPLYLGAIITGYGLGITLDSTTGLIIHTIITLPYLYYRARLEEELLLEEIKGYDKYMEKTGMFLPKFLK